MENMASSTIRKPIWKRMLPWLGLVIALAFLAWPLPWLLTGLNIYHNQAIAAQPGFGSDFGDPKLIAESAHFRILAYEKYASQAEANVFLAKAEEQYPKLAKFLGVSISDHSITIVLLPQCDGAHGGLNFLTITTCNNKLQTYDSFLFLHELTHALVRPTYSSLRSSFIEEGLADAAGNQFEWGVPFILEDDIFLYESMRAGDLIPLTELRAGVSMNKSTKSSLSYAEAGSFIQYLINRYGVEKFHTLYYEEIGNFETVYEQPFEQLEDGWLRSLQVGNLVYALLLTSGGLLVLMFTSLAMNRGWQWVLAVLIGWLAVLLWSFLLGTSSALGLLYVILYRPEGISLIPIPSGVIYPIWLPAGLLVAALFGWLISRWNKSAGKIALWLVGSGTLIGFVLWPAVRLFFV